MEEYYSTLKSVGLFRGIDASELESILNCVGAEVKNVGKGEIVLLAGDRPRHIGITLVGLLHIISEDFEGNRSLLAALTPGEIFAEALCCAGVSESPVTVMAEADSAVMLLSFSRLSRMCPNSCPFHSKLIENMLSLIAKKSIMLQSRMELLSLKSVRAKVLRYLQSFAQVQGREIVIPFNREEMADFLCVERSALSHELARMKKEGLIEYRKNIFTFKAEVH